MEALIPYFTVKIIDPLTGSTVVSNLPHQHQITYDVRGLQSGATGASSIGSFSIPLFAPDSDQAAAAEPYYSLLRYGQRVEIYDGDVQAGDPSFTGVITGLPNTLSNYTLTGSDSLWLLQRARTDRNYLFNGSTDTLFKDNLKAYSLVFGDDLFSSLAGYTNNGTWTLTTEEGLPVAQAGAGGDGLLYTTTTFANANYSNCVIDGAFHITCGGTPGNTAEAGIIAAVADASNLILGRANMVCVSASVWRIDLEIWTKIAGVYTLRNTVPWTLNLGVSTFRGQVRLFGVQNGANYTWRVILNGIDTGSTYTLASTPSGFVGFRSLTGSTRYMTYLTFFNKTAIFQQGTVTAGSYNINQKFSKVPQLDLLNIAATTQSYQWRKNPKAGLNNDTIDFGLLGSDLSATVSFEQNINLIEPSTIEPNAEHPATDIELNAANSSSSGTITWHNVTAMRIYGVIADTASSGYVADFLAQRALVKAISDLRASQGVAKNLTVIRDARYGSSTISTGMLMRELDIVAVTSPSLNLFQQKVLIVGYTITEGQASMGLIGDQFSKHSETGQQITMRRMGQILDQLANAQSGAINTGALAVTNSGVPLFDGSGLISVMSRIATTNIGFQAAQVLTFGGAATTISGSSTSFTLTRTQTVLVNGVITVALGNFEAPTTFFDQVPIHLLCNAVSSATAMIETGAGGAPSPNYGNYQTVTLWQVLTLTAGTYAATWVAEASGTSAKTEIQTQSGQIDVFLIGG